MFAYFIHYSTLYSEHNLKEFCIFVEESTNMPFQ